MGVHFCCSKSGDFFTSHCAEEELEGAVRLLCVCWGGGVGALLQQ